jgi:hypothetical protein
VFVVFGFPAFEPAGEQRGSVYDPASACPDCGSGARLVSALYIDWSRIPKGRDVVRTIAGEILVSRRLRDAFREKEFTGAEFVPIGYCATSSAVSPDWFQLIMTSNATVIDTLRTRTGIGPFDDDPDDEYRCPRGDLIGLNRLSEVWIHPPVPGTDIAATRQSLGIRRGLLRPQPLILVSARLREALLKWKVRRCVFEIAHLAGQAGEVEGPAMHAMP